MICPAVRTTHSFSDADILSVFSSDNDIVNEVSLFWAGMHPRCLLSSWEAGVCVKMVFVISRSCSAQVCRSTGHCCYTCPPRAFRLYHPMSHCHSLLSRWNHQECMPYIFIEWEVPLVNIAIEPVAVLLVFFPHLCELSTIQQNLAAASFSNFICLFSNSRRSSDPTIQWPLQMTLMSDLDLAYFCLFNLFSLTAGLKPFPNFYTG